MRASFRLRLFHPGTAAPQHKAWKRWSEGKKCLEAVRHGDVELSEGCRTISVDILLCGRAAWKAFWINIWINADDSSTGGHFLSQETARNCTGSSGEKGRGRPSTWLSSLTCDHDSTTARSGSAGSVMLVFQRTPALCHKMQYYRKYGHIYAPVVTRSKPVAKDAR